jgi:hypothetical protein
LYIDLFVIIPIAVASEWCHHKGMRIWLTCDSGPDIAVPQNSPETADCESRVQEGPHKYHRSDRHQLCVPDIGIRLGPPAALVRDLPCASQLQYWALSA